MTVCLVDSLRKLTAFLSQYYRVVLYEFDGDAVPRISSGSVSARSILLCSSYSDFACGENDAFDRDIYRPQV
jgi:hypothetical protein